ncbi:hypothetical protein [Actinomadura rugatobispora]|uniref:DUF4190 domain-containing protein n=1 Tax=Actinomadura rugatobispora TaxID=1994 RepID=A0ABW1A588_9ACTN|nr:hypothetical protein GCM10010200_017760 [Actinomadura rugatobispora]
MLDLMVSWMTGFFQYAAHLTQVAMETVPLSAADDPPVNIPSPNDSQAPPRAGVFLIIVGWIRWGGYLCCIVGFFIVGARMSVNHKRGEASSHVASIIVITAGGGIITIAYFIVERVATLS